MPNKHRKSRETRWLRKAGGREQQEMGSEVLSGQQDRRCAPGGHCKSLAFVLSDEEELRADVATRFWFTPGPLCTLLDKKGEGTGWMQRDRTHCSDQGER